MTDGDAVIVMDSDLQDPPELIREMLAKFEEGMDVVYAVRRDRLGETWFKKMSSTPIPSDTGDFRLMSRRVVAALRTMREQDRFVRGMVSWVGFMLSGAAGIYIIVVVGLRVTGHTFPGYASLMIAVLLLGGIQQKKTWCNFPSAA